MDVTQSTSAHSWWWYEDSLDEWTNETHPLVTIKCYDQLELTEEEQNGKLTNRIISSCSSCLMRCPQEKKFVAGRCDLNQKGLHDLEVLRCHKYLQYLDLSHNCLTDVKVLSHLTYLTYLNVSHNFIEHLLDFQAPLYLTYADYSYNSIKKIGDLTVFWSIVHLNLSDNHIAEIEGLQNLKHLRTLNLARNAIEDLKNLDNLKIQQLNLEKNRIKTSDNTIRTMRFLKSVNLSQNLLEKMIFLRGIETLEEVDLSYNFIKNLIEIDNFRNLRYLRKVSLKGNPVAIQPHYQEVLLDNLANLKEVDGQPITIEARVQYKMKNNHTCYHAELLFLQQINNVDLPVYYVEMIVLVGPPASQKGRIVGKFCGNNKRFTRRGVSHTTRTQRSEEDSGVSYYYISHEAFKQMLEKGAFLTTKRYYGEYYGFAVSEIPKNLDKVLVFHTDLKGAILLKTKFFSPKLVLALPSTEAVHMRYINRKYPCLNDTGIVTLQNEYFSTQNLLDHESSVESLKLFVETRKTKSSSMGILKTGGVKSYLRRNSSKAANVTFNMFATSLGDDSGGTAESNVDKIEMSSASNTILDEFLLSSLSKSNTGLIHSDDTLVANKYNFANEILSSRQNYFDYNQDNPGFFRAMISTDQVDESLDKLKCLLKDCVQNYNRHCYWHDFDKDPAYQEAVEKRLSQLHKELKRGKPSLTTDECKDCSNK